MLLSHPMQAIVNIFSMFVIQHYYEYISIIPSCIKEDTGIKIYRFSTIPHMINIVS
jgi:hypothetical protein